MIPRLLTTSAFVLSALFMGCDSSPTTGNGPTIESSIISVDQLPKQFQLERTYRYRENRVEDPEGLLITLWDAGIRSSRAWQPLDDICLDPLGPRFTVELQEDDPRIEDLGFEKGVGRLFCARKLMAYRISE